MTLNLTLPDGETCSFKGICDSPAVWFYYCERWNLTIKRRCDFHKFDFGSPLVQTFTRDEFMVWQVLRS